MCVPSKNADPQPEQFVEQSFTTRRIQLREQEAGSVSKRAAEPKNFLVPGMGIDLDALAVHICGGRPCKILRWGELLFFRSDPYLYRMGRSRHLAPCVRSSYKSGRRSCIDRTLQKLTPVFWNHIDQPVRDVSGNAHIRAGIVTRFAYVFQPPNSRKGILFARTCLSSLSGLFRNWHWVSKIIVGQLSFEKAGQSGNPAWLGLPKRAK